MIVVWTNKVDCSPMLLLVIIFTLLVSEYNLLEIRLKLLLLQKSLAQAVQQSLVIF